MWLCTFCGEVGARVVLSTLVRRALALALARADAAAAAESINTTRMRDGVEPSPYIVHPRCCTASMVALLFWEWARCVCAMHHPTMSLRGVSHTFQSTELLNSWHPSTHSRCCLRVDGITARCGSRASPQSEARAGVSHVSFPETSSLPLIVKGKKNTRKCPAARVAAKPKYDAALQLGWCSAGVKLCEHLNSFAYLAWPT